VTRTFTALAAPVATACAVGAATGYLAAVDPEHPGHYPVCLFHSTTGLWCPGCGCLRAVHALAHADLATACHRNALLVLAAPVLVLAWAVWVRAAYGAQDRAPRPIPPVALWSSVALVAVFGLLRNLPFAHALAP
jgi:uncharacterized protein DUF2752